MPNVQIADWWTGLLATGAVASLTVCLIVRLREWGTRLRRDASRWLRRPWFERGLLLFLICGMVQYAATKGTRNANPQSDAEEEDNAVAEIEIESLGDDSPQETEAFIVTNLCFTGISVLTNGVELRVAWPTNFFASGTTLDFFAKHQSLTNVWQWFAGHPALPGMTNVSIVADWTDDLGCDTNPPTMFFKVQDRTTCAATMADSDCDGLPDVYELHNGTNPYDAKNYCFNLSLVEEGVFSTTNALTAEVVFGTNVVAGPTILTNRTWEVDLGHLVAYNREAVVAYFWDDANSNGVRDADECQIRQPLAIAGHENALTKTLASGEFDRDKDGILDYWESLHSAAGLSPTNAADAFIDSDADGLINLHEFWAGCDPSVPDGSNTVLSVMARSVDDRIRGLNATNALPIFEDYIENGNLSAFVANTNCWLYGIDYSCASPWMSGYGAGNQWAGTLISPRHVITATHFTPALGSHYVFRAASGATFIRQTISQKAVAETDICVVLLDSDLPNEVAPARVLPENFGRHLSTGAGLPMVCFDQEEKALVQDVSTLVIQKETGLIDADARVFGCIPRNSHRATFYEPLISGDSGNPRFLLLGNQLVLVNITWHGGGGDGSLVSAHIAEIEAAMNELSSTNGIYRLNQVDLSGYDLPPRAN